MSAPDYVQGKQEPADTGIAVRDVLQIAADSSGSECRDRLSCVFAHIHLRCCLSCFRPEFQQTRAANPLPHTGRSYCRLLGSQLDDLVARAGIKENLLSRVQFYGFVAFSAVVVGWL